MRAALVIALVGCNRLLHNGDVEPPGDAVEPDACLACTSDCAAMGKPATSVSGTVTFPNGTLPVSDAVVYVPQKGLDVIPDGPSGPTCVSGDPLVVARTDVFGHFQLDGVPATTNLPVVIQLGKWRREITVPTVTECTDNPIDAALTHLPRTQREGHIPRIAIATGAADTLECIVRKVGIDDTEITASFKPGRVHLYAGDGAISGFSDGTQFATWTGLVPAMPAYDLVALGCAGHGVATAAGGLQMSQFVSAGGSLWLTHFHFDWFQLAPSPWPSFAVFDGGLPQQDTLTDSVDTSFPGGATFAAWLVATRGSSVVQIDGGGRNSCVSIDSTQVQRWTYLDPVLNGNATGIQTFSWTSPRGGRVMFSDMHVGTGTAPTVLFPDECGTVVTAEDQAVLYQMFEADTCVTPGAGAAASGH